LTTSVTSAATPTTAGSSGTTRSRSNSAPHPNSGPTSWGSSYHKSPHIDDDPLPPLHASVSHCPAPIIHKANVDSIIKDYDKVNNRSTVAKWLRESKNRIINKNPRSLKLYDHWGGNNGNLASREKEKDHRSVPT